MQQALWLPRWTKPVRVSRKLELVIIANFGTFDVNNYGDSLFPLIVEKNLKSVASKFIHVSPIGGQAYRDVPTSVSYRDFEADGPKIDAVVIAGGNTIHGRRTPLLEYSPVQRTAYASLWAGAAKAAARNNAPLIINSPGVPQKAGPLTGTIMRMVFDQAAYASVRDHQSRANLGVTESSHVNVVPDTAILLSRTLGAARQEPRTDEVAVHVNHRYASSDLSKVAYQLDLLSEVLDLKVHLIGIGVCHGDDILSREISERMSTEHLVTANPKFVGDVATVIARSRLYVGSSLHGFITASSYAVPALIVADELQQHKFTGLLGQLNASERMMSSWDAVLEHAMAAAQSGLISSSIFTRPVAIAEAAQQIDEHWRSIRNILSNGRSGHSRLKYLPAPPILVAGSNIIEQTPKRIISRIKSLAGSR